MYLKKKDWDVADIFRQLRSLHRQINSPYNDGFTGMGCKKDFYMIKNLVNDLYEDTAKFAGEEEWDKERTVELLKRNNGGNKT